MCSVLSVPCSVYLTLVLCGDCPSILCVRSTLICSSVDVCLGCFCLSNIVDDSALNMDVCTLLYYIRILRSTMRGIILFSVMITPCYIPTANTHEFLFSFLVSVLGTFHLFILSLIAILISIASVFIHL